MRGGSELAEAEYPAGALRPQPGTGRRLSEVTQTWTPFDVSTFFASASVPEMPLDEGLVV